MTYVVGIIKKTYTFFKNLDARRRQYNDNEQKQRYSHARNSSLIVIRIILDSIIALAIQLV